MKKKHVTKEFREKRSQIQLQLWKNSKYKLYMSKAHKGQKAWNKGIPLKEQLSIFSNNQRKEKISKTLKKLYKTGKRISAQLGTHISKKHKEALKKYMIGRRIGEKNPNWKGGIALHPYTSFFKRIRNKIKERDKYICQKCFSKKDLTVHHIDYKKFNDNERNLITLCRSCNGQVNTNKKFWEVFFNEKISFILYCRK